METGGGGSGGRGIRQPPEERSLQPEWRRPSVSAGRRDDLILQPEWRRRGPLPQPSNSSGEVRDEEELLLQPEWRRSKPNASGSARQTAFPWNQNYGVRKPGASSSGVVQRNRDYNDSWRSAPAPAPAPAPTPAPDSSLPKLERLKISEQIATSFYTREKEDKISPIRRPDNGGTMAILTSRVRVNHFPVKFNPESIIMHYNVGVKPKCSSKLGQPQKFSKSDLSMIREKLFSDDPKRLPLEMTAYDGAKTIYSAVQLPEETFTVEISEGEDEKSISYCVTINLANKFSLHKLMDYLNGNTLSIPRDILQGLDVVMKRILLDALFLWEDTSIPQILLC